MSELIKIITASDPQLRDSSLDAFCREHGLFLISDEVYRELAFDGAKATSVLEVPGTEELAVVTDSLSKRYSACGARVGCLFSRNAGLVGAAAATAAEAASTGAGAPV